MRSTRRLTLIRPGRVPYAQAWDLMRQLAADRSAGRAGDSLMILEHPPTITLGNRARPENILVAPKELSARGVDVVQSDRGGDVTYHAPGQIVGYPVLKLSQHGGDIGRYVRNLEETIILTLGAFGLAGERVPGLTGVWVGGGAAKVCAIGVKLSAAGVTSHGFALNVNPDLAGFAQIVPCGIDDRAVTSLQALLGREVAPAEVEPTLLRHFAEVFDVDLAPAELALADDA
ncbi:lipoyl(octanoyl) transferase LipB [Oscillochloris sp. ZM17-4]|uniref:lipoyl(octanoyl) transferase LipB n=1 Tax=Oscillochloris sp. ZM17-4 TaxID=2866714 RepID=UPI001C73868A|nr:lipoyl(octanoyl) transferase LipB [Oscillochloris sp. ZM17-4]MBX0327390.1 lipoyl(octanoyl) transferase LipB [Oscillochloris sp. ZM17-4]